MAIPVYSFTGFLEAGKTKFIQETLEDTRFNQGERTLVLVCEEGEEEYDVSTYPYQNVFFEVVDMETVTTAELDALLHQYPVLLHEKIREKVEADSSNPQYIETIWGVGYRFKI